VGRKLNFVIDRILQASRFVFKGTKVQSWAFSSFLYEMLMKIRASPNLEGDFTVKFHGLIFHMEPSDITILPTVISGEYEKTELAWLKKQIEMQKNRKIVFIDVGANVGIYSLIVAKLLKTNDHVWSIEPDPRNVKRLKKNILENSLNQEIITILETGIGQANGKANFHLSKFGGVSQIVTVPSAEIYEIPIRSLDDLFLRQLDGNPHIVIKIDVEGFENFVLLGSRQILEKYKPDLIIEIFPNANNLDVDTILFLASLYDSAQLHIGNRVVEISDSLKDSLGVNREYGNLTLTSKPELEK
jgi:FkbM family methyltransferase